MSRSVPNAWNIETDDSAARADEETRISDFVAFFALSFPTLALPVVGVPLGELAGLLLGLLALLRRPAPGVVVPGWFTAGIVFIPLWLLLSGGLNGELDLRRMAHLTTWVLLAGALASGRISVPSAIRGLVIGLPISCALSLAGFGVGPTGYTDRLSGWIGDPNSAAYYLAVLGLLCLAHLQRPVARYAFAIFLGVAITLTYSRTGLLIVVIAVLWMLVGRRLKLWAGIAAVAGVAWLVQNIPDDLRLWGPFEDRQGSDALRQRIVAAEQLKLDAAPWWGNGPGTSQVSISHQEFFFHSSYYGALNEGGWLLLGVLVALVVAVFVALGRRTSRELAIPTALHQMALIAALLMAFTLGEVLLDLPLAIALGMSAWHAFRERPDVVVAAEGETDRAPVVRVGE